MKLGTKLGQMGKKQYLLMLVEIYPQFSEPPYEY